MAVLTISSLTLTSNKYNFVRTAQLYREQKLLAAAKCGDAAAFNELFQPLAKGVFRIVYRVTKNREDAEDAHAVAPGPPESPEPISAELRLLRRIMSAELMAICVSQVENLDLLSKSFTIGAAKARLFHARVALRKDSGLKAIARTTLFLRGPKKCQG